MKTRSRRAFLTRLLVAALAAGAMLVPSGSAAQVPIPDSKVGKVKGTGAYIAVAYDGRRVQVYVCNGTSTRGATISKWFRGAWDGESPLTLGRPGLELEIEDVRADGRVSGHLHWNGKRHDFTVRPATGAAGLYNRKKAEGRDRPRGTWIFLSRRSYRGVMVDPRPRRCRPVQVTLADGTTAIVTVCKLG